MRQQGVQNKHTHALLLEEKESEIQFFKTLAEDLKIELVEQKENNFKKVTEIERLNQNLKGMFEKKIDLLSRTGKEDQNKAQKYKS